MCPAASILSVQAQIGLFSYPDGTFHPITNDLTDHNSLSLSADGHTLATVQKETSTQIVLMPPNGAGPLTPVPGIATRENLPSFSWTGDGQLLISHGDRLVRQHTDGTHAVTILSDPAAWISDPVSCDNDRWIALNWMVHGEGSGNRIWRANPDGSDARAAHLRGIRQVSGDARRTGSGCTTRSKSRTACCESLPAAANPNSCRERILRIRSRFRPHFPLTARRWRYLPKC